MQSIRRQILLLMAVLLFPLAHLAGAQELTTAPIVDPAYGIKAFTITIPAGWKFQGTVLPGPECSETSLSSAPTRPTVSPRSA